MILFFASLAACRSEPAAPPEPPATRPPEAVCNRARADLEQASATGLLYEQTGEAMIERTAWLRMEQEQRDRLMERLAELAACSAPSPQRETEVTVRSEAGAVIAQRRINVSTHLRRDR